MELGSERSFAEPDNEIMVSQLLVAVRRRTFGLLYMDTDTITSRSFGVHVSSETALSFNLFS